MIGGRGLLQAWLDAAARAGLHPGEVEVGVERDRLRIVAREVVEAGPDTLRLRTRLVWIICHRAVREELQGEIEWAVPWSISEAGLTLGRPEPLDDGHARLYAWGAAAGQLDLGARLADALARSHAAPAPLAAGCAVVDGFSAEGAVVEVPAAWAKREGVVTGKAAWTEVDGLRLTEAGVATEGRGYTRTVGHGGAEPVSVEVRPGSLRWMLTVSARPIDAWHEEVFGVRIEVGVAAISASRLALAGTALAARTRRPIEATLTAVVRGPDGTMDGLRVRSAAGADSLWPVVRARAAAASGMLRVIPAPGLALTPEEGASLRAWGVMR